MSDLVGNPEDRFSHNEAQMKVHIPSIIAGFLWHPCEGRVETAKMVPELTAVTPGKQVLVMGFTTYTTSGTKIPVHKIPNV